MTKKEIEQKLRALDFLMSHNKEDVALEYKPAPSWASVLLEQVEVSYIYKGEFKTCTINDNTANFVFALNLRSVVLEENEKHYAILRCFSKYAHLDKPTGQISDITDLYKKKIEKEKEKQVCNHSKETDTPPITKTS